MDEHVVLVDEGEVLRRPGLGLGEGVADQALHPVGRVDADLGGDLVRRALAYDAAVTAVEALGALAHHDEVDVARIGQRRRHARVVHRGTQVDVVVQGEAQAQEQAALEHAGGDRGIADGSQQVRVCPVRCQRSAPRSKVVGRTVTPVPSSARSRTLSPSGTTSLPMPSPGITASLMVCVMGPP